MALRINTNVAATKAARNLDQAKPSISRSVEHLASVLRLNNVSKGPAGVAICENLHAELVNLRESDKTTSEASNLIQTAEVSPGEINTTIIRMHSLAIQANTQAQSVLTLLKTPISSNVS